ncbi:hypothetical protein BACCIP111899_00781 [Bacillus rhizoplanae]|uniref:Uncharacterized protein n=1 Tax=Bacillus rhizoplanae TaxID=2880966 RepID=A0ABM8Y7B0_9BACI|nr:hypothetical protein BACCIP111899_00781 [Bacillus rhizoplanae]
MIATFTTIFGSGLASHTITEEFQKRTIKQLLIHPRKRLIVLLSKHITILLAVLLIALSALFQEREFIFCSYRMI